MKKNKYEDLQSRIQYTFKDSSLLTLALSHRSIGKQNNERLEFLGDAILAMIVSEYLYNQFPDMREGDLTRMRANLVKGETLSEIALAFDLGDMLLLGVGEKKSGGRKRLSILADCVEAIIGGIYLDAGEAVCRQVVLGWFEERMLQLKPELHEHKDPKTKLQEYAQGRGEALPQYTVVEIKGQDHARSYVVECRLNKSLPACRAESSSKRTAEKHAAELMLAQIETTPAAGESDT